MEQDFNGYELSRQWFDFCFENPEKISPNHSALYFFIIEHCNRLGWKEKFGLPMEMTKEAIGIKNYRTYANTFKDLVDWGFIIVLQRSTNQYSSNIIGIVKNAKAKSKAMSKATQKQCQKQDEKQHQGIVGIDKPNNLEPLTFKPNNASGESFELKNILNPIEFPTWRDECKKFMNDGYFKNSFSKSESLPLANVEKFMSEFLVDVNLRGLFKDCAGLKSHFKNYYPKHFKPQQNGMSLSKGFLDIPDNIDYENAKDTWD